MNKIANIFSVKNKIIIPAPMCGIMDSPFRETILDFGSDFIYTEMIASHATILENKKYYLEKSSLMPRNKNNAIFVVQIAGCNPDIMARAAKMCQDEFGADVVDMNFGCPVKKVTNGHAGSALMKDEELSKQIIEAVCKSVSIPVSIKMRMGWDFEKLNAPILAKIAEDSGIQMITVHGRTRSQLYSGKANWEFIKQVKNAVKVPVIANGDINEIEDAQQALSDSNADGVMIARGLYGRPWLIKEFDNYFNVKNENNNSFQHIQKPKNIWKDCISKHLDRISEFYSPEESIGYAIKHLFFYSKGLEASANFRQSIAKNQLLSDIYKISEDFFSI